MSRVLMLTSLDLSTNPRLRKEIEVLLHNGHHVELLCQKLNTAQSNFEHHYTSKLPSLSVNYLSCSKRHLLTWTLCTLVRKLSFLLLSIHIGGWLLESFAENKFTVLLYWHFQFKKYNSDLVIGHTLGGICAGLYVARRMNCPFVIDVEDYHPGEQAIKRSKVLLKVREDLLKRALETASLCTFSSPMIKEQCEQLAGTLQNTLIILNTFWNSEFEHVAEYPEKVSFVWFSQHIDYGRGLELFLAGTDIDPKGIEVHLVGNLRESFKKEVEGRSYVFVHSIMNQESLHSFLFKHSIGLAIDNPKQDLNRNICLTNKLMAYLQAGQYVIYSDTPAQLQFMNDGMTDHGISINLESPEEIAAGIKKIVRHKKNITKGWSYRYDHARRLGYENQARRWYERIISLNADD